jgi:hypothetical protein
MTAESSTIRMFIFELDKINPKEKRVIYITGQI